MIALTAMTIQIIDNNPDGIRICRVDGESLVTVVVPRDMLSEAKSLPDLPDRGVYYLLDEDHGVLHQRKLELLQNIKKSLLDKMFV